MAETRELFDDLLIGTKRHLPSFKTNNVNLRIVQVGEPGKCSFPLGYSLLGFNQIGGDVEKGREPTPGCLMDDPVNKVRDICIPYIGSGLEVASPADISPMDFLDDQGNSLTGDALTDALAELEYSGYYQRLFALPTCFKVNPFLSRVVNLTSADVTVSIGDDTDCDDPNALTKYANKLAIPKGEARALATDTLIPHALEHQEQIGIKGDAPDLEPTNCMHWLTLCADTVIPKGEKLLFYIVGSYPC